MVKRAVLVVATVLAGCGGVKVTCQTQACEATNKSYQICASVGVSGGSEQYKFGGSSCSCASSDTTACEACSQRVAVYCAGDVGDGGLGSDMAIHSCTMTATGAVNETATCTATTVYASGSNLGGPTLTIQGSNSVSLEATITRPGMVTSGTWSSTDTGTKGSIDATMGIPTWDACQGCSTPQGSWTMDLTVESMSTTSDGATYIATGTINATLPPITATGATGTVTFTASF